MKIISLIRETAVIEPAFEANEIIVERKKKIKPFNAPIKNPFSLKILEATIPPKKAPILIQTNAITKSPSSDTDRLVAAIAQITVEIPETIKQVRTPNKRGFIILLFKTFEEYKKITPKPF